MARRDKRSSVWLLGLFILLVGVALYLYNSKMFERNAPIVTLSSNGYWNLKDALKLDIRDESGVKAYKIYFKTSKEEVPFANENFIDMKNELSLEIKAPKVISFTQDNEIELVVESSDASKWNFFAGNEGIESFKLKIDKKRPTVAILANSYSINQGGAALVVFKAEDEHLKSLKIETNFGKDFIPQKYYKEGYYVSLIAWPVVQNSFKATVVAVDQAGNETKAYIPLYLKSKEYKVSNIKLDDGFLKGKIAELASEFEETQGVDEPLEQFKLINETVRAKNEALIHEITSKVSEELLSEFKINKMYPLKNGQVVAHFGDHRKYYYEGNYVSESYHLGLDLASNAMASIKPQNGGEVVFSDYNGLYGNMPIIHHGLGLYTLYGHCTSVNVTKGDAVSPNQDIASTGKSGYAMGDHLHFGVLVQGIEVRPAEWMDESWMKDNIYKVMKLAKEMIDRG